MTYCIDTMLMVWGIERKARRPQDGMVERAEGLFRRMETGKHVILIPAPAFSEFLSGIPKERRLFALTSCSRRFRIAPFDAKAATLAADLWTDLRSRGMVNANQEEGWRTRIKVDCQIVAVAISQGAHAIFSYDPDIAQVANGRIPVLTMPEVTDQIPLFDAEVAAVVQED